MTRILQIVPEVRPGSGVEAVAYHLEREWRRQGIETARFTLADAGGSWLGQPGHGLRGKLNLAARVVWFSTVGTLRARRVLRGQPAGTTSICHNDVLAGDVYVNHGNLRVAMRARGHYVFRMVRNPLHLFTSARDCVRYQTHTHRVVVNLTEGEQDLLQATYSRLAPRTVVIPNGVDTERFRPPSATERQQARAALGVAGPDKTVAVFVGHEFERKGLHHILKALVGAPDVVLVVVGGDTPMVAGAQRQAVALGVADRVRFVGRVDTPVPYLYAGDVFVLPSAYEANALAILEALACGVPVIASRVGFAPEIIRDWDTGFLVDRNAGDIRRRILEIGRSEQWRSRARASALEFSWTRVAQRYLDLVSELAEESR